MTKQDSVEEIDYTSYTMEDWKKELSAKEFDFCLYYVENLNGADAARRAGYSEKSAYVIASQNLTKLKIKAFVQFLRGNLEEATGITIIRQLKEYAKTAYSSIADLHESWVTRKEFNSLTPDQKACIKEIDSRVTKKPAKPIFDKEGNQTNFGEMEYIAHVKIKLRSKSKAQERIDKLMGYEAPIKLDPMVVDVTFSDLIDMAEKKENKGKEK